MVFWPRVCMVPWCRCVTPLPDTFLFIYRWLVSFFHVLHDSRSIGREAPTPRGTGIYDPQRESLSKTAITYTPATNVSTVLRDDYHPLALSYSCTLKNSKYRFAPVNISLTTRPQSYIRAWQTWFLKSYAVDIPFLYILRFISHVMLLIFQRFSIGIYYRVKIKVFSPLYLLNNNILY